MSSILNMIQKFSLMMILGVCMAVGSCSDETSPRPASNTPAPETTRIKLELTPSGNSAPQQGSSPSGNLPSLPPSAIKVQATPSNKFKPADIAKLKWIEGTWKGMDGDKPFYGRYRFENGTTLVVETFGDETMSNVIDSSRYELKNGEFGKDEGKQRMAASEITDYSVQFVPAEGEGNSFRFEQGHSGTWKATLEWPAMAGQPAGSKVYRMEPWPKVK